jgi:uncharacterized protein
MIPAGGGRVSIQTGHEAVRFAAGRRGGMSDGGDTIFPSAQPAALHISRRGGVGLAQAAGPNWQYRSARGFEWTELDLPVAHLPESMQGLRIVHLSDFHGRGWWDPAYDDLIALLRRRPPDLILFTGDFVDSKRDARPALPVVRKLMSQLPSRLGTFAILGNHDGDLIGPPLAGCNVTLLDHRRLSMPIGQGTVELIGLPGVDREDLDLPWVRSLGKKPPGTLRIVLCHYPDLLLKTMPLQPDLYLTGHTHGGQIAWPNRLPIFRHDSLPRRLCSGIHEVYGTVLVANRGMGFSSLLKLRLFCPAEAVEITVRRN